MNRRKRPFWLFILSLLSLGGLIYLIINYSPSHQLEIVSMGWRFSILYIFFSLSFFFLLFFISYVLRNYRQAILIGMLTLAYSILKMFRLDSTYFLLLLFALYISLALFLKKKI